MNDADSLFYKRSYDNLLRNILESENAPAVMLLFMEQTNGTSAQDTGEYFPNGWICEEGDGGLTVTLRYRNLGILYLATIDGKSGSFDILIDGESVRSINADFAGGWGNAVTAAEVYTSDEEAEHTVTIKKTEGTEKELFWLLGFLIS